MCPGGLAAGTAPTAGEAPVAGEALVARVVSAIPILGLIAFVEAVALVEEDGRAVEVAAGTGRTTGRTARLSREV
jgi:hypothetical protein